jgi:lipopolysaccharide export LptBFGC system permease protein LptF
MARVIDPMLADLQLEYARALEAGAPWRARRVQFAGYVTCVRAVVLYGSQLAWRALRESSDDELRAVRRVAALAALSVVLVTTLFALPFWLRVLQLGEGTVTVANDPGAMAWLLALLLPQALPTAIPVALMLGISVAIGSRSLSSRVTAAAVAVAFCGSLISFGAMGWGAPLANQEFRTTLVGSDLPKGSAELTLGELRSRRSRVLAVVRDSGALKARPFLATIDLGYYRRYALPAAPIVLVVFLLARRRNADRLLLASQGAVACGIYFALMVAGNVGIRNGWMYGMAAAWLPNIVFLSSAAALLFRRRHPAIGV